MKKLCAALAILVSSTFMCGSAIAQTADPEATSERRVDPMDMSEALRDAGGRVPTVSEVNTLRDDANRLLAEGDCDSAKAALQTLADRSNRLSNIISAGLRPFYDARGDDRRNFSVTQQLVDREALAGNMIRIRNRAWVDEALCLIESGDEALGVARLVHALRYISVKETETWDTARNTVWRLSGAQD